ncbi:hypothetical protein HYFRA_00012629 [Hymenoscyphus fraxineus]|uniref:AAA+ ATPase domain-containing protein n=1 Tax=Hymenoscyphus fraxineus TaxID=746836 RepID=A0A9N9PTL4_9HELO|nr:hypothetical protein HYFRA_00012629 [Hymenoscyphus fraxineus]
MSVARIDRLKRLFADVNHGRKPLKSSREGNLFIESICVQEDAASCIHQLISSDKGLASIQSSVRFDTSTSFLNGHAVELLKYLQNPELAAIESGAILARIILNIVQPPFFWDAIVKGFRDGTLGQEIFQGFAWLLLQLITLPGINSSGYVTFARSPGILDGILKAQDGHTRNLGQKISHALPLELSGIYDSTVDKPGGRHDNDHEDHRKISLLPTADELLSNDRPYLRTPEYLEDVEDVSARGEIHLDNQFRLLREDMLGEIREELMILTGKKAGRHRGTLLDIKGVAGLELGTERKRAPWAIEFQTHIPQLKNLKPENRKSYLKDNNHILRHGNIACVLLDNEPVAFPTIFRDEEKLARDPSIVILQFQNDTTLPYFLLKLKNAKRMRLVQLDTAIFSYSPFLNRLQEMRRIPLAEEILACDTNIIDGPTFQPVNLIRDLKMRQKEGRDLQSILGTRKSVKLNDSQMGSLLACISQRISAIQGPPGTGKSFVGALAAKALHDHTKQVILVVCFTNHALDQFLEDLLDIGIPPEDMVRLGGKSTDRTRPLMIREQTAVRLGTTHWRRIDELKKALEYHESRLRDSFGRYHSMNVQKQQIMDYLEFLSDDKPWFDTFTVPLNNENGMTMVGKGGKAMSPFYLLDRWQTGGKDAGSLQHLQPKSAKPIWNMDLETRRSTVEIWRNAILEDIVREIQQAGKDFNDEQIALDKVFAQRDASIIKSKRIIACTTNGAAKYSQDIQSASPGIVLVEEAGEILEAHILTAMGKSTEQLIMIGDHKQLRPKCSYPLSVEQGDGFDLNRSLFERLVLKGFPHVTLTEQHRMRPEISSMVRHLTYPDLTDATSTQNRDDIRGLQDNLVFINHTSPELVMTRGRELRDGNTASKQNLFEAQMMLKCVRYLAQQGYGSDKLVVLTPYGGQLKLLREELSKENDPVLNDMDKFDLIRAGLLTDLGSKTSGPRLRISTIDNYQGEESDIVLISMTRSNNSHDIGFMSALERVNVLLSRARNGMIIVGNSETFLNARKGQDVWRKVFGHLRENGHIYEGLPVKCEKHPTRVALLKSPDDFDANCPDGGCKEPCGAMLSCGIHQCPSSCHQIVDHSKMKCMMIIKDKCPNGHTQQWYCHSGAPPTTCPTCERERRAAEKKAQKALEEKLRREEKQQKHLREVAKIQEQIDEVTQSMKDLQINADQAASLEQKKKDLVAAKELAKKQTSMPQNNRIPSGNDHPQSSQEPPKQPPKQPQLSKPAAKSTSVNSSALVESLKDCLTHNKSSAKTEWQRQKDQDNASNEAIDAIMDMIGLEDVKSQVLRIKAKVETAIRQGTDLKKERLGLVLLGNPGTGKTTVARLYAKVLSSLQVLPGDGFIETTGSKLAHGGVSEVQSHFKNLENSQGGVFFVDEAYQLAEGHSYGGKTVLDFLLAEIENLTGKVVFVFAGYRSNMEKFFEHNPGFSSRIPYTLHFEDYTDAELLSMLQQKMHQFFKKTGISIEDGPNGLFMRITVKRLGRGRGKDGFGNARALENLFGRIRERQADRLSKERAQGLLPNDFHISKEDLIGPDPSEAILQCTAWDKLQKLTGLKSVKESVSFLIDLIMTNYKRELKEQEPVQVSLNRVFLGSPGTGKTTVAKLYGQILSDLGLLSNGEVVAKNPADFIGNVIGQSEANTKAILKNSIGKVLIIDEAYMLHSSSGGSDGNGVSDSFKTAVIDTIVAEVQSVPGEDRCVLLLGYEDEMRRFFQNVNPGLTRRFQLSEAFHFDDFTDSELQEILLWKLQIQGLGATPPAISTAIDVLSRLRNGLNFGNGGDVENLISKAKGLYQLRQSKLPAEERSIDFVFEPQDFDPDYNRAASAETNLQELFKGVIGCEGIVDKLSNFLKVAKGMSAQGLDPRGQIPMAFIFKGPPGTGKTTTARKIGQVYYDLGFLSQVEVVECSATDLVGQYVGHTGPKVIKQLERGLGKVLFIDEAYRLGEGHFAQEAIDEIVDTMTKPKFAQKMVIILAGYDEDMNHLLRVNEGLSSRFADEFIFPPLDTKDCLQLLEAKLKESNIIAPGIQDTTIRQRFLVTLAKLSKLPAWGNARDVQTLAKSMVRAVYANNTEKKAHLILPSKLAIQCIDEMLSDRLARQVTKPGHRALPDDSAIAQNLSPVPSAPAFNTSTAETEKAQDEPEEPQGLAAPTTEDTRDDGVSDATWEQLQKDKKLAELANSQFEESQREQKKAAELAKKAEEEAAALTAALREKQAKDEAEANELLRKREEARIREVELRAERERIQNEIKKRQTQEMERRKKEERAQQKLRQMGVCVAGFRWIKQGGGYRCAGGSHWVSDAQIGV